MLGRVTSSPTIDNKMASSEAARVTAQFSDITRNDDTLSRFLHGLPGVDQVGAEARAAGLGTRSIKTLSLIHI